MRGKEHVYIYTHMSQTCIISNLTTIFFVHIFIYTHIHACSASDSIILMNNLHEEYLDMHQLKTITEMPAVVTILKVRKE